MNYSKLYLYLRAITKPNPSDLSVACFWPFFKFHSYLGRMLPVRRHPPPRVNLEEGTCKPEETQHLQSGRLTGSVEKERREKSQPPAPERWIY